MQKVSLLSAQVRSHLSRRPLIKKFSHSFSAFFIFPQRGNFRKRENKLCLVVTQYDIRPLLIRVVPAPQPLLPGLCASFNCKAVVAQARVTLPQTNPCPFFLHTSPNTGLSLKLLKYGCNCHCTPPATHPCNTNMCASNPGCTICIFRLEIPLNFSKAKTFVETSFLLQVHATDHEIRGWL